MNNGSFFFKGIHNSVIDKTNEDSRIDKARELLDSAKKAHWSKINSSGYDIYKSKDNKMYVFKGGEHYVLKGLGIALKLDKVKVDKNGGMPFKEVENFKYKNVPRVSIDLSESTLDTEKETEDFDAFANILKDDNKSSDGPADLTGMTTKKRVEIMNRKRRKTVNKFTNTISLNDGMELSDDLGDDLSRVSLSSLKDHELMQVTYDIIKGLKSFHDNGAPHTDLKKENILVKRKNGEIHATIIDPPTAHVGRRGIFEYAAMNNVSQEKRYKGLYDAWLKNNNIAERSSFKNDYFCIDLILRDLRDNCKGDSYNYKFLSKIIGMMDKHLPLLYILSQITSIASRNNYELKK